MNTAGWFIRIAVLGVLMTVLVSAIVWYQLEHRWRDGSAQEVGRPGNPTPAAFWDQKITSPAINSPRELIHDLSDDATSTNGDPIARAFNTQLSSVERNQALESMAQRGTVEDIDGLVAILATYEDNEIIASWGAQHLGMIWDALSPSDLLRVREVLVKTLNVDSPLCLLRREASFALAQLNDGKARESVTAYVEKHIYSDNDSDLDNVVRVVGLMRLTRFVDRVEALVNHPVIQVSGAAKEARALCAAH